MRHKENSLVLVDTAKTVLVPVSLYEEGMGERYLRFGGMALAVGERVVVSEPRDGIVAVMGVDAKQFELLEREYSESEHSECDKGGVNVTSPLFSVIEGFSSENPERLEVLWRSGYSGRIVYSREASARSRPSGARRAKREVNILLTDENAYIAVWEKELRMAEVLPDNSDDSLLYYMQVLGRSFRLKKFDINICGSDTSTVIAKNAADALKPYFGKVRVVG